jgi:hypothetical protein
MRRTWWMVPVIAIVVLMVGAADVPKRNMFSDLEVGQPVSLKDHGSSYEISMMDDVAQGHTIVEIGDDFLVVEDVAGVTQTMIPMYSLKGVVRVRVE